ncbi:MAG: HAD-IB family phosphatase [Caulobacteraceae bacterium]
MGPTLIIDFDSTFVGGETLDVLAEIVLAQDPDRDAGTREIAALTQAAMNGEIEFGEALRRRLAILCPSRAQVAEVAQTFRRRVTPSIARNAAFFRDHAERVFIVSGGFREVIEPVVADFGVSPDHVLANTLVFNADDRAGAVDDANPLAESGGKAAAVRTLNLDGEVVAVGDGWTDYEIRQAGAACRFHAFTEIVRREKVVAVADHVAASFEDVLRVEGLA